MHSDYKTEIAICPCNNHPIKVTLGQHGYYYHPQWDGMDKCIDKDWEMTLYSVDMYIETKSYDLNEFNQKLKAAYLTYRTNKIWKDF